MYVTVITRKNILDALEGKTPAKFYLAFLIKYQESFKASYHKTTIEKKTSSYFTPFTHLNQVLKTTIHQIFHLLLALVATSFKHPSVSFAADV